MILIFNCSVFRTLSMNRIFHPGFILALVLPFAPTQSLAYDINEQVTIGGILAGAIQCQNLSDAPGFSNTCESAVPFQPEVSIRPTEDDEVFFKLGFAAGNGLNDKSPFKIPPWAADLEDEVKNINGRNRDYLLTAWYQHTFSFADNHQLGTTFGIIDATDYLDENAYANDEYTQFLNSALTNGPNVFLPSYDLGVALQWDNGPWSLRGVLMDIGENDDGNNYSFYGLQAGYSVNNKLGAGNYRIVIVGTSEDFLDPTGTQLHNRTGILLSFDQEFGQVVGGWIRFDWQSDDAALDYNTVYSGGIDIKGKAWGRNADNIGLGYAYLDGGNLDIEKSQVAEAYYRWQLSEVFGLTADVQYMQDDYKTGSGPRGWIVGLRATAEF
jgi:porin